MKSVCLATYIKCEHFINFNYLSYNNQKAINIKSNYCYVRYRHCARTQLLQLDHAVKIKFTISKIIKVKKFYITFKFKIELTILALYPIEGSELHELNEIQEPDTCIHLCSPRCIIKLADCFVHFLKKWEIIRIMILSGVQLIPVTDTITIRTIRHSFIFIQKNFNHFLICCVAVIHITCFI